MELTKTTLGQRIKQSMTASLLTEKQLANMMCIPLRRIKDFINDIERPNDDELSMLSDYIVGGQREWLVFGTKFTPPIVLKND